MKDMDPSIGLSDQILGDLMLEASGLSAIEQLMVLTSVNDAREFDTLAQALMEQHPKIQTSDRPKQHDRPRNYHPKGGKSRG